MDAHGADELDDAQQLAEQLVGDFVGLVVVGEFGDLVDEYIHPSQVHAGRVGLGHVADAEPAQDRRALLGQRQDTPAGGQDFPLRDGDLGVAVPPCFGFDPELEIPEHEHAVGGRDRSLDAGQQHRLAGAGGADELVVRVLGEVEDHRVTGLGSPDREPAGLDLPRMLGDADERVAAQDAQLEEPGLLGQLDHLHRLNARGMPQRDRGLGVLPEVLPGPQSHPHGPAVRVDPVAVEPGHGVHGGVQPGVVGVGVGALDREAGGGAERLPEQPEPGLRSDAMPTLMISFCGRPNCWNAATSCASHLGVPSFVVSFYTGFSPGFTMACAICTHCTSTIGTTDSVVSDGWTGMDLAWFVGCGCADARRLPADLPAGGRRAPSRDQKRAAPGGGAGALGARSIGAVRDRTCHDTERATRPP